MNMHLIYKYVMYMEIYIIYKLKTEFVMFHLKYELIFPSIFCIC